LRRNSAFRDSVLIYEILDKKETKKMKRNRRLFLSSTLAFLLAWKPLQGWTKPPPARGLESGGQLAEAMDRELKGQKPRDSDKVSLEAPDSAEDGAIVPIAVASALPEATDIWVFVEKNPNPLAAVFSLDASLDTFVSLRIKMNESCEIIAVVKSGEDYFSARKKVRVTLGGCG
jgi:sulfur-oxidizing protein SoxY